MKAATRSKSLLDIDEVAPLQESDMECINEIRDVLGKHGQLERFGLCLLHEHFECKEDEVMVEYCDIESRTLTVRPTSKKDLEMPVVPTAWRLDNMEALVACGVQQSC